MGGGSGETVQSVALRTLGTMVDANAPLMAAGLDSLSVAELVNALSAALSVEMATSDGCLRSWRLRMNALAQGRSGERCTRARLHCGRARSAPMRGRGLKQTSMAIWWM